MSGDDQRTTPVEDQLRHALLARADAVTVRGQPADLRHRVEARQRRRTRTRAFGAAGGVAVAAAVAVTVAVTVPGGTRSHRTTGLHEGDPASISPAPVDATPVVPQGPLTPVPDTSGIPGVLAWDTSYPGSPTASGSAAATDAGALSHDHTEGTVTYATVPPVGGPHAPDWMNCGVYDSPVPAERAVHDLEHGAVWITYRPDLPADQVALLRSFVRQQHDAVLTYQGQRQQLSERYVDLSPWNDANLPAPVVISAWGRQLRLSSPTDPRLQRFVDAFRVDPTLTYEASAECGGEPASTGGMPAFR